MLLKVFLLTGSPLFPISVRDWMETLSETIKDAQQGNADSIEAVLTAQVLALDAIFANMAYMANRNNRMDQIELCMRLALKAQNQSRATLQTLAQIKNPQKAVFMKQANIAHGQQQVNNAPSEERKEEKDSSRKKSETEQNKLLEADEKGETGWTLERRAKQAKAIRQWKPWEKSTGPTSKAGKKQSARNAYKGGDWKVLREQSKLLNQLLKEQRRTLGVIKENRFC